MCRLPLQGLPAGPPGAIGSSNAPSAGRAAGPRAQPFDDEFLQFQYKVVPCTKNFRHDFATCPFAHAGESSERRHPSAYLPFLCCATQHSTDLKEKCPFGTTCKYAHSHFELWLHPGRFRTKLCSLGAKCKRPVCFFAHSEQELRATPYARLDTAAAVAAQQLADMGQAGLEPIAAALASAGSSNASLLPAACGGDGGIARTGSSIPSPGSSEMGRARSGSGGSSPSNSLSREEATVIAKLRASMAALNAPAAALLDVGGAMPNGACLGAAAAAGAGLDCGNSLSGSAAADLALAGGSGLWALQQQQQQLPYASASFVQQAALGGMLDTQLLGLAPAPAATACGASELWAVPASACGGQWPAVGSQQALLVRSQQQLALNQLAVGPPAVSMAPCLAAPTLLGHAGMQQWLQVDGGLRQQPCAGMVSAVPVAQPQQQQAMQQLLSNQAVQQLLGMM